MIRNTVLGLAAAATLALTASAASAGGYGYGHGYNHYNSYNSYSSYSCQRIFVGYRSVWTYYGYVQKPIYKKVCGYGY
ncbi:MAG: hypothetical protein AB7S41_17945 [Parvibaculaceae bacterium]